MLRYADEVAFLGRLQEDLGYPSTIGTVIERVDSDPPKVTVLWPNGTHTYGVYEDDLWLVSRLS